MAAPDLIRFGACEIRTSERELLLDGQIQVVEPRTFDLLVYLIEHRDRVVPHQELFDRVWAGAAVSENVIANGIMKARRAIGDGASPHAVIRTVHRVGYRFVGQVFSGPGTGHPGAAPPSESSSQLRLGLLPFENLTGDPELDWVTQGLAALVSTALGSEGRLHLASPADVASVLGHLAPAMPAEAVELAIEHALGLQAVVVSRLRRRRNGYALEYEGLGAPLAKVKGRLQGDEPTALGQRMAHRIAVQLFPDLAVPVRFHSGDVVANQNFARAMQAISEERWESAAKLLRVVLDIEPANAAAELQYVHVLAALEDPTAISVGHRLLDRTTKLGDERGMAAAHHTLAHALQNLHGPTEEGSHHIDEALRLADASGAADWVLKIHFTRARHEHLSRRWSSARQLYAQVASACEASGNRLELVKAMNNRAAIESGTGNFLSAREWLEETLDLSRTLNLDTSVAICGANLAMVNGQLGLMSKAVHLAELHSAMISSVQNTRTAASLTVALCGVFGLAWQPQAMQRTIARLEARGSGAGEFSDASLAMARGLHEAVLGRLSAAGSHMRHAIDRMREMGEVLFVDAWLLLLFDVEMRKGQPAALRELVAEIGALATPDRKDRNLGLTRHAEAVLLHQEGRLEEASAAADHAVDLLPVSAQNALARLDAAWLHLELGEAERAQRVLRIVGPWTLEHPAGVLVQARLDAALGDDAAAAHGQQQFLRLAVSRASEEHRNSAVAYLNGRVHAHSRVLPSCI